MVEPAEAEAVARRFAQAMLGRDPRTAAACFSAGARILTADGTEVIGREKVLAVLRQITSSEQNLKIRIGRGIVAGGRRFLHTVLAAQRSGDEERGL